MSCYFQASALSPAWQVDEALQHLKRGSVIGDDVAAVCRVSELVSQTGREKSPSLSCLECWKHSAPATTPPSDGAGLGECELERRGDEW